MLKQQAIRGIKWTSISTIIVTIFQVLQISILARYLSEHDFGLMAIILVVIGFSYFFSDFGIGNAIIHRQEITHNELSTLYWFNIFISFILFIILSLFSPLISNFYNEPLLVELIIIVSINFVITAFGNQHRILFQKNMKFNLLAKIEMISTFVSFMSSVLLAIYGYGIYSLIYATILKAIIATFMYIFFGIKYHKPSLYFKFILLRSFISFGLYKTAQSILGYFNSQFDVILIGKLLGTEVLGTYSIMKQLAIRPIQLIGPIVTKVTFPVLAKVQNEEDRLKNIYLKTIYYTTFVSFPIYLLIIILAEPIVIVMFGEKWTDSTYILQILAIFFMLKSTGNSVGSLVMATGKVHLEFWWNVALFFIFPITIYFASFWDIEGIAISLVMLRFLMIIPMWFYMMKPLTNISLKEYLKSFMKPLVITIISVFLPSFVLLIVNINIYIMSLIYSIMTIIIYIFINKKFGTDLFSLAKDKNGI